jgi:transcriptional regulator with XRE-family HTH domain
MTDTQAAIRDMIDNRPTLPDPAYLKAIRQKSGLTQREVAEAIGVTPGAVKHYEAGRRHPRGDNLTRYSEAVEEMAK